MLHAWRWFGPDDPVTLSDIAQAGAVGVVTALHQFAPGDVWPRDAIAARKAEIEAAGLAWSVVESLPVSEEIKLGAPAAAQHLTAYFESLENLAAEGIATVCYNFMPVLDWTRTEMRHRRPNGALAMRFDLTHFAAFDIHVLARKGAEDAYPPEVASEAAARAAEMSEPARQALTERVIAGLPGSAAGYDLATLRTRLEEYARLGEAGLRANLRRFLSATAPEAERLGLRLCCHPDDPPFPLLGLPRIVSTEADYAALLDAHPSQANGITLCAGSLGVRPDNDLPAMMRRFGPRVHFLHLRNTRREASWGAGDAFQASFFEDAHLEGDVDMPALIHAVVSEERRRATEGRVDAQIPMRPDHGQETLTDIGRDMRPGYPAIGRLRGLAELRGVEAAFAFMARNGI